MLIKKLQWGNGQCQAVWGIMQVQELAGSISNGFCHHFCPVCFSLICQDGPSVLLFARLVLGRFLLGLAHSNFFFLFSGLCFVFFVWAEALFFCKNNNNNNNRKYTHKNNKKKELSKKQTKMRRTKLGADRSPHLLDISIRKVKQIRKSNQFYPNQNTEYIQTNDNKKSR